mgnify:FL=1
MSEQFWWHLTRASGIVAWLMLTALVLWGIVLATDLFPEHRRPAWLLAAHRWLAWLSLGFVGVHVAALVADNYVAFGIADILVPFASDWKPAPVAVGVLAMWGLVAVQASSLARRHLSKRTWRGIHLASYASYWLASLHGTFAGTDANNRLYVLTSVTTLGAVVFAGSYRVLTRSRRPMRPLGGREPATTVTP